MSDLETKVALLQQTDKHIMAGLEDIKLLLKEIHSDNKAFQETMNNRVTRLEYNDDSKEKKMTGLHAKVTSTNAKVEDLESNLINLENFVKKIITQVKYWGAGVTSTIGAGLWLLFR